MDPDAALKELLEAISSRDWDCVDELAAGLLSWMEKRGFPPTTVGAPELGPQWHRTIATFVCYAAQGKVKAARKRRDRKQDV
jgi:hypothetical protein